MSDDKTRSTGNNADAANADTESSFLQRWSKRKTEVKAGQGTPAEQEGPEQDASERELKTSDEQPQADTEADTETVTEEKAELTDADMPPLDSIDQSTDISQFFSPKVSAELRRLALRKMFHLPAYNIRDGLNDYDDDYTRFEPLGDIVTSDMKHMQEVEKLRRQQQQQSVNEQSMSEQEMINIKARDAALTEASNVAVEPTSLVSYRSGGYLLIIGDARQAMPIAQDLTEKELSCAVLATSGTISESEKSPTIPVLHANQQPILLSGHLGEFSVILQTEKGDLNLAQGLDRKLSYFDLILDLQNEPLFKWETPPFGYYASAGKNAQEIAAMIEQLAEMTGEFEKPKFFAYNASICAHGASGITACTRCIDTCPTGAITSLVEKIEIDPYYCQGGGSCASACPTGAITYSYPQPADMVNRLRQLLRHYREAGGSKPILLFHDSEAGADSLASMDPALPGHVIPIEVEEIGSVGIDVWFNALAFGAARVILLDTAAVPSSVRREIDDQLTIAKPILLGMGYPAAVLSRIKHDDPELANILNAAAMPVINPAGFAGTNEKRNAIFAAVDWLYQQAPQRTTFAELPMHGLFGNIQVDRKACTLCMACVSVCPASALADGAGEPKLNFIEANCVQCGLCETACPEDAITRLPRFVYDREKRMQTRVLNEEAPFHCISCGKAFATQSVIEKMLGKLNGHWMFQDEKALQRLKMCGDCRVIAMYEDENK